MKIKDGFLLKEIAGEYIVVPVGENLVDFSAMIALNETGAFLWDKLKVDKTKKQLINDVLSEYNIDEDTITKDIDEFVEILENKNLLI